MSTLLAPGERLTGWREGLDGLIASVTGTPQPQETPAPEPVPEAVSYAAYCTPIGGQTVRLGEYPGPDAAMRACEEHPLAGGRLAWVHDGVIHSAQGDGAGYGAGPARKPAPVAEPESVPEPVDGAAVLDETRAFLARFVKFPSQAALDVVTLWIAHTHATDNRVLVFGATPRLMITSEEKGSGKTRLMEMLALLCPRAVLIGGDVTGPAMSRLVEEKRATLLVDETDLLFGRGEAGRAVRAFLNSGYRRGAVVARAKGDLETFAPAVLAGLAAVLLGNPALETAVSRSVIVRIARAADGQKAERFRDRLHTPLGVAHRAALEAWGAQAAADLATCWPELPEGVYDRDADVWEPLGAVAQVAGGAWPARFAAACREMVLGDATRNGVTPPRIRLARDMLTVWPAGSAQARAADLAPLLRALPGSPWAAMWPSEVTAAREIPALLGVPVAKIRLGGGTYTGWDRVAVQAVAAVDPARAAAEAAARQSVHEETEES